MGNNVKKIVGAIYLKNGRAMKGFASDSVSEFDAVGLAEQLSNSNADELIVFDLSPAGDDKAHEEALDIIKERYGSEPVFFVFSDNKKYADDFFSAAGLEYRLMDYETEDAVRDDMFLMSRCSHNIMANSSYSWWGAWLNRNKDKTVICPEKGVWGGDFYPEGWMKVTASSGK